MNWNIITSISDDGICGRTLRCDMFGNWSWPTLRKFRMSKECLPWEKGCLKEIISMNFVYIIYPLQLRIPGSLRSALIWKPRRRPRRKPPLPFSTIGQLDDPLSITTCCPNHHRPFILSKLCWTRFGATFSQFTSWYLFQFQKIS